MKIRKLLSILLSLTFVSLPCLAKKDLSLQDFKVKDFVLPSELSNLAKRGGSVFYNQSSKATVLIPVNMWGEVTQSGLHFLPADTSFISGLSMAGGPNSQGKLSTIKLMRKKNGKIDTKTFDLTNGGPQEAYFYKLKPHDTIFVEKSTFYQDRSYYTSLVSVAISVLTGVVLYNQLQNQ